MSLGSNEIVRIGKSPIGQPNTAADNGVESLSVIDLSTRIRAATKETRLFHEAFVGAKKRNIPTWVVEYAA